jgi:hypothetical protein
MGPIDNPYVVLHWKIIDLSYDIQFDNCDVKTWYVSNPLWPFGGTLTGLYKNISCEFLNDESISFIDGEVVYLPEDAEMPIEQEGIVFLVNDSENCQEKIDNLTNASGLILVTSVHWPSGDYRNLYMDVPKTASVPFVV